MVKAAKSELLVLTANRLGDGAVVFFDRDGRWSNDLQEAAIVGDADVRASVVAVGERDAAAALVVGPYLIGVTADGEIVPVELRERIRASGLTFRAIAAEAVTYF